VGARKILVAYNIDLDGADAEAAKEIARRIRESGRRVAGGEGRGSRLPGRLAAVRALGWYLESYGCAQVSVNLLDFKVTPLHAVFEAVKEEAESLGLRVTGSEIVGLVPLEPLVHAGRHYLEGELGPEAAGATGQEELVEAAVRSLGLDSRRPFELTEKILEIAIGTSTPGLSPLA
jgi:glutamate formiminotransferase/formiminotetrahydrofolate cyclodeaminase